MIRWSEPHFTDWAPELRCRQPQEFVLGWGAAGGGGAGGSNPGLPDADPVLPSALLLSGGAFEMQGLAFSLRSL